MLGHGGRQLLVLDLLLQLRQHALRKRLLDRQELAELLQQQVARRLDLRRHLHRGCLARNGAHLFWRSFCVMTVYFGSAADWKPALNTDQRRASSPPSTSAPPSAAAA